jgi:hypothetical protein
VNKPEGVVFDADKNNIPQMTDLGSTHDLSEDSEDGVLTNEAWHKRNEDATVHQFTVPSPGLYYFIAPHISVNSAFNFF